MMRGVVAVVIWWLWWIASLGRMRPRPKLLTREVLPLPIVVVVVGYAAAAWLGTSTCAVCVALCGVIGVVGLWDVDAVLQSHLDDPGFKSDFKLSEKGAKLN